MPEIQKITINSSHDNLPLSVIFSEAENPKGVLQCCHGMVEHKERYIDFIKFMAENGYHCFIHDMRGHGKSVLSPDDLGYFYENGKEGCIADLKTINDYIKKEYPKLPIFLFGHSMGSLEVRAYCKYHDDTISGLIVCGSPAPSKMIFLGIGLIKILSLLNSNRHRSIIINNIALSAYNKPFSKESNSKNNWISVNKANVQAFDADPLCGFIFTLNGFSVLMELMTEAYNTKNWKPSNPNIPILFISGENDPCKGSDKDFQAALNTMKKIGYSNINHILYPGLRHEIFNEKNHYAVYSDILNNLDSWL